MTTPEVWGGHISESTKHWKNAVLCTVEKFSLFWGGLNSEMAVNWDSTVDDGKKISVIVLVIKLAKLLSSSNVCGFQIMGRTWGPEQGLTKNMYGRPTKKYVKH